MSPSSGYGVIVPLEVCTDLLLVKLSWLLLQVMQMDVLDRVVDKRTKNFTSASRACELVLLVVLVLASAHIVGMNMTSDAEFGLGREKFLRSELQFFDKNDIGGGQQGRPLECGCKPYVWLAVASKD